MAYVVPTKHHRMNKQQQKKTSYLLSNGYRRSYKYEVFGIAVKVTIFSTHYSPYLGHSTFQYLLLTCRKPLSKDFPSSILTICKPLIGRESHMTLTLYFGWLACTHNAIRPCSMADHKNGTLPRFQVLNCVKQAINDVLSRNCISIGKLTPYIL